MVSKILSRLHHYRYHNCYHQHTFFRLFIHSFIFSHRVPSNLFQKLLLRIFEKCSKMEFQLVCLLVPGRLLSLHRNWRRMAVYQSWVKSVLLGINEWHSGLRKRAGICTWESGQQLSILKWRDSEARGNDNCAEISNNGGLFDGISWNNKNAYICDMPVGKITFQP